MPVSLLRNVNSFWRLTESDGRSLSIHKQNWLRLVCTRFERRSTRNELVVIRASEDSTSQVDRALLDAQNAAKSAQDAVPLVPTLPSAYPPHPALESLKESIPRLVMVLTVGSLLYVLIHGPHWLRLPVAVFSPAFVGYISVKKGSLSPTGGLASWLVGFGAVLGGFRCVIIVLSFFISSSILTKFKDHVKATITSDHKKGGQRDWIQVFSNGFLATIFCLVYAYSTGLTDSPLGDRGLSSLSLFAFGGVLGNYACTCGDTWASELGVLSKSPPRLITTMRPVHPGTNGGVTVLGLLASLTGGLFVGLMCFLTSLLTVIGQPTTQVIQVVKTEWPIVILGMTGGLVGSLVDSLLGATLQFSGFDRRLKKVVNRPSADPAAVHKINGVNILSNNQVNLISSFMMSLFIGQMTAMIYG
eukprot:g2001.t1